MTQLPPPEMMSVAFARGLAEALELMGVGRDQLFHGLALSVEQLSEPIAPLPRQHLDALVERAVQLTGEPALGLLWWQQASFGAFGAVGHALSVTRDFRAGVALIERYWPLFMSQPLVTVREQRDSCRIVVHCASPSPVAHRAYMEASAFALCRFLRQCAGVVGEPSLVCFDYPAPPYVQRYESILRCPLRFDCEEMALEVPTALAHRVQLNYARELEERLLSFADALLAAREREQLSSRVLDVLRKQPELHRVGMEQVAAQLGLSERTLRRRLQAEGVPYPQLMQHALRERAETLLQDPSRSVKQVAYALGFADPSAFHRAVRRWTGKAPGAFRRPSTLPPGPTGRT